jgi:hypothetical protein
MPEGSDKFNFREDLDYQLEEEWNTTRQRSLVQRAGRVTPRVPSLTSSGTVAFHAAKTAASKYAPPEPPKATRHMLMPEFVSQKREIFLIGLMINRRRAEIAGLAAEAEAEKARFSDAKRKIVELGDQYKATTARLEAGVARGRISAEAARKRRIELQKEYTQVHQRTALFRKQIAANRRRVEDYHRYVAFVRTIVPDGVGVEHFYKDPANMTQELRHMQDSIVILIGQLERLGHTFDKNCQAIGADLTATTTNLTVLTKQREALPSSSEFTSALNPATIRHGEQIESELVHLTKLVAHSHAYCFGGAESDLLPALLMLERIANALDDLFLRLEHVDDEYAEAKQKIHDEQRLEQRKLDLAARRTLEQKLKADAAVERAQLPIKKRTGRPSVRRMLPIAMNRRDPARDRAARLERERLEGVLYGPDLIE